MKKAIKSMQPGDTCLLRAGRYEETLYIRKISGTAEQPLAFKAWPGEKVIIDGSDPLLAEWTPWKNGIYRTKVAEPVLQLFIGDRLMMPARWPNADLEDNSAWDLHGSWRHLAPDSTFGHLLDSKPVLKEGAKPWIEQSRAASNNSSLASLNKSFTGATIVLNIGSWLTWAQTISKHDAGSNEIHFDTDFTKSGKAMASSAKAFPGNEKFWDQKNVRAAEGYYYIEGSLDCLDAPGEWFHDHATGWLYVIPRDSENPDWEHARVRVRDHGVDAQNCAHLIVQGINFFSSNGRFFRCRNTTLKDCRFDYPSASGIPVGDFTRPKVTWFLARGDEPSRNVVSNCVFENCDGPAIEMKGHHDLIENCLFRAVDWTCLGTGGEGSLNLSNARNLTFRRNTLDLAGNSEGVRVGPANLIEYNLVSRTGLLQHDGSAINVGVSCIEGTTLRRNWIHNTPKAALRFDSANMGTPEVTYGSSGAMIENVAWKTMQFKIKGEDHRILANTAFDNDQIDLAILDHALSGGINKKTITAANLADEIAGSFRAGSERKPTRPIPGEVRDNHTGNVRDQLRDPDHRDFRPQPGAAIIAATEPMTLHPDEQPRKRDIGAYQSTSENYWIPGRCESITSHPVPPSGATAVPLIGDLMWRQALNATAYQIYWGDNLEAVTKADKSSPLLRRSSPSRVFSPPARSPGQRYFWRVDAVTPSGVITGHVWSYQLSN